MEILKTSMYLNLEHKIKEKDFIQFMLNKIFLICKNSKKDLSLNEKENILENKITELKQKINKYNNLLNQYDEIQKEIHGKISFLEYENEKLKNLLTGELE